MTQQHNDRATLEAQIELPSMAKPQVPRIDADIDLMDIRRLAQWCERTAKDYARAAIEHDRKSRGEPVAWRWSESNGERWFDWTTDWTHHDRAVEMGCLVEYAAPSAPQPAEPRLDKPAMVGSTRFGEGVPWRIVVEAAQRRYEFECTPEKEKDRITRGAEAIKRLTAQPAEPVKEPSDEEIEVLATGWNITTRDRLIGFARALLARYGNAAQPAANEGDQQ